MFIDFWACGHHFLPCGLLPRPRGTKAPKTKPFWFPALCIAAYSAFLGTFVWISDHAIASYLAPLLVLQIFLGLRHKHSLPCGGFPPPQGHKPRPKEVDACLFHDQPRQQSRNHSTSPNSQPSSTASSRCSCVRSSSQQQPRSAAASRQRRCTVCRCRCSVEVDACISGSELR